MIDHPMTVFIVDADAAIRDSVAGLMALEGLDCRGFSRGDEFLTTLHELDTGVVACVICAYDLPDQSGIEVYRDLKHRAAEFPFLLMISRHHRLERINAHRAGIAHVIEKPIVNPSVLVGFVVDHLFVEH